MEDDDVFIVVVEPKTIHDVYTNVLDDFSDYNSLNIDLTEYLDLDQLELPKRTSRKRKKYENNAVTNTNRIKEILIKFPNLNGDETALITFIVKEMQKFEPPPVEGVCIEEISKGFQCNYCLAVKPKRAEVERHWQEYHGPRYLFCMACGLDFRSRTNLYRHEKNCRDKNAHFVRKARAIHIFNQSKNRSMNRMVDHPNIEVPAKKYECDICIASFNMKSSLVCHKKKHEIKKWEIPLVNKPLLEHVKLMNRIGRSYVCHICQKAYRRYSALYRHKWSHMNEKFICDTCGRTSNNKVTFIDHIKLHTPRFACPKCPLKFSYKASMTYHIRREHLGLPPPCLCTICSKRFSRRRNLHDHLKKKFYNTLVKSQMKEAMIINQTETTMSDIVNSIKLIENETKPLKSLKQKNSK